MTDTAQRISTPMAVAWASGQIGASIMLGAVGLLVMFYLTEYLGISPTVAGLLIFISRGVDVAVSLAVGQWSDRLRSPIGRHRPFMLAGAPVAAIAYALLFAAPGEVGSVTLLVSVSLALVLWAAGYTLFVVPFLAMPSEITTDPKQRTTMMSWRVVFMTVAGVLIAGGSPELIRVFGGGRDGYAGMGAVQAVVLLAAMWGCVALTWRARTLVEATAQQVSFTAQLRLIARNRPFLVYLGAKFCQLLSAAATTASLLYLVRYVLGQDEGFLVSFAIWNTLGTLLSIPVWAWLGNRFGKRNTYMASGLLYALVALSWLAAHPAELALVTNVRLFMIGVGAAGMLVLGFSLLPDTMDYDRQTSGVSKEATLAALYNVVEKGAAAVGPLCAGILLDAMGFVSAAGGEPPESQSDSAILAILLLAAVIPAVLNVLAALLLTRFSLERPALPA